MGYMETYKAWCENEYFDEDTRAELKSIAGDEKEIEDRFYKDLEFGTGGLTTFSTFSAEGVQMMMAGDWLRALAHSGLHLFGSFAATAVGFAVVRQLTV